MRTRRSGLQNVVNHTAPRNLLSTIPLWDEGGHERLSAAFMIIAPSLGHSIMMGAKSLTHSYLLSFAGASDAWRGSVGLGQRREDGCPQPLLARSAAHG
jgi:hypothetical protein